jgi:hypothetical protein
MRARRAVGAMVVSGRGWIGGTAGNVDRRRPLVKPRAAGREGAAVTKRVTKRFVRVAAAGPPETDPSTTGPEPMSRIPTPPTPATPLAALLALAVAGAAAPGLASLATAAPHRADEEAVRQTVQYYLDAQATGDGSLIEKAFHAESHLTHVRDDAVRTIPIEEYVGYFGGEPAEDEAERDRWIESVDVFGDAAMAKVVLDYPGADIVDYMSLLKVDGEWRIIHKNFAVVRP